MFDVEAAQFLMAGRVHPNAAWAMPAHAHSYWEFIYFVRGSGRVDVPSATLSPHAYHLVVYPPGLPHAEVANPFDPEETIFFSADVPGTAPVGAHLMLADPTGELGWLAQHMFEEYSERGVTALVHTYCRAFLYIIDRLWESSLPVQHDAVDVAVQYIHTNFSRDVSLDSLAKAACVSKTHLAHCFSAKLGISPRRYLQHVRIETAKRLLATTLMPIREIAAGVGFRDPLYFSRAMKAAIGSSPKAYRQRVNCASQSISNATSSIPFGEEAGV